MPFKSRAQAAYFNIHKAELERQGVNVDEWNRASKGMSLPKHARQAGGPAPDPISNLLRRYMMNEILGTIGRHREYHDDNLINPDMRGYYSLPREFLPEGRPQISSGPEPSRDQFLLNPYDRDYYEGPPREFRPEPKPPRPAMEFGELPAFPYNPNPMAPPTSRQEGGPVEDTSVGDPNLMWRDPVPALSGMAKGLYHGISGLAGSLMDIPKRAIESAGHYAQTGEYDPAPIMDAAQTAMTGGLPFAARGALGTFGGKMISGVEEAIKAAPFKQAPAEQWLGYLQNKPGIKKEEMEYMGIPEYLSGQSGPLSKEQMTEQAAKNRLELKDIVLGGNPYDKLVKQLRAKYGADLSQVTPEESAALGQAWKDVATGKTPSTRHGPYQLPGGEDYREHLMQKISPPMDEARKMEALNKYTKEQYGKDFGEFGQADQDYIRRQFEHSGHSTMPQDETFYYQTHWGSTPNVLAHVRYNDRTINGKKTLFIEELQSDWHQQGRQKGYFNKKAYDVAQKEYSETQQAQREASEKLFNKIRRMKDEGTFNRWDAEEAVYRLENEETRKEALEKIPERLHKDALAYADLNKKYHEVRKTYEDLGRTKGIPEAPLKTSWPEMAMQRILKKAADEGYEQVAWTSGAEQAQRYWGPAEKRIVNKLRYEPDWGGPGRGRLDGYNEKSGDLTFQKQDIKPEELARLVGKETAEQLIAKSKLPRGNEQFVTGLNKDFQAHGMEGFYDKMMPIFTGKIGKPYGGKMEKSQIYVDKTKNEIEQELRGRGENAAFPSPTRASDVHVFHIPEKMREDLATGALKFPMFRARGGTVFKRAKGGPIPSLVHNGMLNSDVPGRTDNLNISVPSGAYVIPADIISGEGQGNSLAGSKKIHSMFTTGPLGMKPLKRGRGPKIGHLGRIGTTRLPKGSAISAAKMQFQFGGTPDESEGEPTPILAAGGEYIVHPHIVRKLGRGDLKTGHRILDAFVLHARKQHLKQIKNLKPPVKT